MQNKNIVGPLIRTARKNSRITQSGLAARLQLMGVKIDRAAIAKVETGRRPVSDIEIDAIAKVLMVDVGWFFKRANDKTE